MNLKSAQFQFLVLVFMTVLGRNESMNFTHERFDRSLPLLFRNPSATTFICGFGIPVHNLNPELVTVGMVFKAQQFLPTAFQALNKFSSHRIERQHVNKYESRQDMNFANKRLNYSRQQDHTMSKYRIFFYKALEQLSTSLRQKGHDCVLKMICEATTFPFHYRNGIFGELMYILLTPSSSIDTYQTSRHHDYVNAEKLGKSGLPCEKFFQNCNESILERVTNVFD